ncbi:hypothetical protein DMA11_10350 [Marinilabiliaceae bacterium JC017]|nr:hypothetical protein DMA11_10350 [Marinilabiliaceae bacterium JC017]
MRILGRVEFTDEEEKNFFYEKAKELGYSSFKDFAIAAMKKEIENSNYTVSKLNEIAEIAADLETVLGYEIENDEVSKEIEQAQKVAQLIYNLAVHTDIMVNDKSNQVFVDDPADLEPEEEPYWRNKHALLHGFDISKYLNL